jgi:hypothetical protein
LNPQQRAQVRQHLAAPNRRRTGWQRLPKPNEGEWSTLSAVPAPRT